MALVSFPNQSTIIGNRLISNIALLTSDTSNNLNKKFVHRNLHKTSIFFGNFQTSISSSTQQKGSSLVPFDAKSSSGSSSSGEDQDRRALDTVLKLYTAIKNQNVRELSDIIGDECRCVCNFISFFQPFQGKKQVLDFFSYLIRSLGDDIEFVVKPTLHDGLNVGVSWKLVWNKTHVPLGKGFSFYICQMYQGKVIIRNVEMFMEPLLHMEPFRLKIMGYMMTLMNLLSSYTISKHTMKKALYISFILFVINVILFFSKPGLY